MMARLFEYFALPLRANAALGFVDTRRKQERILSVFVLFFVVGIVLASIYFDGSLTSSAWSLFNRLNGEEQMGTGNPVLDCENPSNENTPYCQERKARIERTWKAISRYEEGKAPAFSLTERE
ncbi:MAG: hypothetical protein IT291_06725 [Deltaproteobacteria bacterium]|nr:hypothetical protein [Deltaproteobacteria bacterium]